MSLRLCVVAVLLVGLVNTHSVSLRSNPLPAEYTPFQVFIACQGNTFEFGAGVPITPRHVLTVASLVRGFLNWSIAFGSNAMSGLQYIESTVGYVHPNFNANTFNNNLGIIVLNSAFPLDVIRPIAMPSPTDASFPRVNQEGTIFGFGVLNNSSGSNPSPNPTLKTVFLTVASDCATFFRGTDVVRSFCAKDEVPDSTNLCQGDLGSAFVVTVRGQQVLAGISSTVSISCESNEPISFARIQSYLPWINTVTSNVPSF